MPHSHNKLSNWSEQKFRYNWLDNYFTTIMKQVTQLTLIMLVDTDVCVPVVFEWEKTGVPGGNPPVLQMAISHANAGYRT